MELAEAAVKKIKLFSGPGTRRYPRYRISETPLIKGVSSDAGIKIKVVNISRGGALLRTKGHPIPGTRIWMNIETRNDLIPLTGFILRVDASYPKWMPGYQAAVAFDQPLGILGGYPETTAEIAESYARESLSAYMPPPAFDRPAVAEIPAAIDAFLEAGIRLEPDAALLEMFRLNDW